MAYAFACGDVVPGCTSQFEGETTDDILVQVTGHARDDHDMTEVPDEVVQQVLAHVREV